MTIRSFQRTFQRSSAMFLSLFALVVFASCGTENTGKKVDAGSRIDANRDNPENCNFLNCKGCCDGNSCVDPVSTASCGSNGSACMACDGSDVCAGGSCVPPTDSCDGATCNGCCMGNQCVPGTSNEACGEFGGACESCSAPEACSSNSCSASTCDAESCPNGCCLGDGSCVVDQNLQACGTGGEACNSCATEDISCTAGNCVQDQPCLEICDNGCCTANGQCIPVATQDEDSCGLANSTCQTCAGGEACALGVCDANPTWRVIANSAIISALDGDGDPWDSSFLLGDSLADPYIRIYLNMSAIILRQTSSIDDTQTPNWDEFLANYSEADLLNKSINFSVLDSDGLSTETIGQCTVQVLQADLDAGTKTIPTCGLATDIILDFELVQ